MNYDGTPRVQVKRWRKGLRIPPIAVAARFDYYAVMWRLTRQEQTVLLMVMSLLLVGLAVKAYRTTHPPVESNTQWHAE